MKIGATPADWVASLSTKEIGAALESLEFQMCEQLSDCDETSQWLMLVVAETKARNARAS